MNEKSITRLQLENADDLFSKLQWERARLEEGWSVYDSFNFVVTAHHLYVDWLKIENGATKESVAKKAQLPDDIKIVFQAAIDLSNGSKHWKLTNKRSLENQVVTNVEGPVIGDWWAYCFGGPMVYIDFDGYSTSMMEFSELIVGSLAWIFDKSDTPFPAKLTEWLARLKLPTL
jgi:hypothetical protein